MNCVNIYTVLLACVISIGLATDQYSDITKTEVYQPTNQPVYVRVGEEFQLKCNQTDGKNVQWFKDDTQITTTAPPGFHFFSAWQEGILISTMVKKGATIEDTASYSCRPQGEPLKAFNVQVFVFDIDVHEPVVKALHEDGHLSCTLKGELYSIERIEWFFQDVKVEDGEKYKTIDINNTLFVYNILHEDVGRLYTCKFYLNNGDNFDQQLAIRSYPLIHQFDQSKNQVQGDPLVLNCEVGGYPNSSVVWMKDDAPIDMNDERVTITDYEFTENGTLRIANLDYDDRAEYTCQATNSEGTSNSTILVRVKDKLAALWPFLGICAEVLILCIIIYIYERRRAKKMEEEEQKEEADHLTNSNDHKGKDDIRQRK